MRNEKCCISDVHITVTFGGQSFFFFSLAQSLDAWIRDDYEFSGAKSSIKMGNGKIDFCFYGVNSI